MQQTNDNKFLLKYIGEPWIYTWFLISIEMHFDEFLHNKDVIYIYIYIYSTIIKYCKCEQVHSIWEQRKNFFQTSNSMNLQWPEYIGHLILLPLLRGKSLILLSQYIAQVFWLNFCVLYFKAACSMTHQRHIQNW